MLERCDRYVTDLLQGCFTGVLDMLQGFFRGDTRVLLRCCIGGEGVLQAVL